VSTTVAIDHPRFRHAERAIFLRRVVADCMSHACRERAGDRPRLDACCQYGVDADVAERDAILARRDPIAALLTPAAAAAPWFTEEERHDADFPSGRHVRTRTFEGGCVFLAHDGRGCAIHRASIEGGWDFHGTKPAICRLFPVTYAGDRIVVSDDHPDYSCADGPGSPTLDRVARDTLGAVFGPELVAALDHAERIVLADEHRRRPGGLAVLTV
jgi:Fe-S-cluster containining protein